MGGDHLRSYKPSGELPTINVMIERLIKAGFQASALADGSQSLGGLALDVLWTELRAWAGTQRQDTKLCAVPNDTYACSVKSQAKACGMKLDDIWAWTWTFCNGVTRNDKIGDIIGTYAILLLKGARWEDMATLVLHLAKNGAVLGRILAMSADEA